jgi:hypothetical protein
MTIRTALPNLTLLAILALFGVASFLPLESMWGINHLAFLPTWWSYLYLLVVALVLYVMFGRLPEDRLERAVERVDGWLWGGRIGPRLVLVVLFTLLFYVCRVETHFLGDGWGWLGIFGQGEGYYHKWTEFGAIHMIRLLQRLQGGYTHHTALVTFQAVSIVSGAAVVYLLTCIIGRLCARPTVRVLALVSLLASGSMLQHFGYVEFYHLLWAAALLFIWVAVRYQHGPKAVLLPGLTLGLAMLAHLQAAYLIAGPVALFVFKRQRADGSGIWSLVAVTATVIAGLAALAWLVSTRIDVEAIFLPVLGGRPGSLDYAVFSLRHVGDMLNQSLLIYPGLTYLATALLTCERRSSYERNDVILGFISVGSLLFLLVVDPVLGMARDWDLMSLTLLPPALFILHRIDVSAVRLPARTVLVYTLVCAMATTSFIVVGIREAPSVNRFYTLLVHYGAKNRGGWANYVGYLETHGPRDKFETALREMDRLYPEYRNLREVYDLIQRRVYDKALVIAEKLVETDPYQADFLQVLGNVHGKLNHDDLAEHYYEQAVRLKRHHVILNELGQLYLKRGKYEEALDVFRRARGHAPHESFVGEGLGLTYIYLKQYATALAVADSLFMDSPDSPGGHLLKLTVAVRQGDLGTARYHYREFVAHGQGRSDYDRMREYYGYVE